MEPIVWIVCIMVGVLGILFYGVIGYFVWECLHPRHQRRCWGKEKRKMEARATLAGIFWPLSVPFMIMLFLAKLPRRLRRLVRVAITGEED
ncbi:hypothetical protein IttPL_0011 [Pseudomonas phage ITTPL]|uniref:Uncharacterized protein n=1 Tax=Pseudomonas phage ITTPL TaxID=2544984 RepID=A0A5B7LVY5_9CAUD|nr:hypothetical protein QE324_gp011 [Pseudomonas phage ITTPL]QBP28026.1 hypothetical protein IttPL_0011 [Pseudomonas phage ITTPL]